MTKRVQHRQAERGWAGLLAVLLCLLWPLASWHELTTRHEVCPEHGERLDVAHDAAGGLDEDGPRVTGEDEDEGHDVCPFTPLAQPAEGEPRFVLPEVVELARLEPATRVPAVRVPAFPRYLLAPKQSPPIGRAS